MCHIIVSHMKRTTIRELKHETGKVLAMVEAGESVEVFRRKESVAMLTPVLRGKPMEMPDFAERLRRIYGERILQTTGTDLMDESRGER
jgi:antitoxin (DNA-binding transcriptional repressor) of toxin-antitoxin stability system